MIQQQNNIDMGYRGGGGGGGGYEPQGTMEATSLMPHFGQK